MLGRRVSLFIAPLAALLLTACRGGAPPTHYYAAGSDWAIYLAWTEDATGHLQGQVQVVGADPNDPARLKSTNASFTGTRNGEDISIAFPLLSAFGGATWTGSLKNNAISLVIPTTGLPSNPTLAAGSFEDFQSAAQAVQAKVNVAQQQQAQQQAIVAQQQAEARAAAQQQFEHDRQASIAYNEASEASSRMRDGYAEVRDSLNELANAVPATPGSNSLSSQYAAQWAKMQNVWEQELAAARVSPMTCYQKGQVSYVAGQVNYELGQMTYLDGQTKYQLDQVQRYFN